MGNMALKFLRELYISLYGTEESRKELVCLN